MGVLLPEGTEEGAGSSAENEVHEHCIHFGPEQITCSQYGHCYCFIIIYSITA